MKKLLLALPILMFVSCGIFGGADYSPMAVGSVWNYQGYTKTDTTIVTTSTSKTEAKAEAKLTSGEDVVEFVSTTNTTVKATGQTTTSTSKYYLRDAGDYILSYAKLDDTKPDTVLALPLEAGKTWHPDSGVTAKVIAEEDVTVKAGDYKAWKTEYNTAGFISYTWLADGIGGVHTHSENTVVGIKLIADVELTSSDIK